MIVFKTYFKVLKKYISPILLYTIILIIFGGFNMTTQDKQMNFSNTKPNILIVNEDENNGITKTFIDYIKKNSKLKSVALIENEINDAIFYREVNYIIYIPKNFRIDFLNGKNPQIKIKSSKDYNASLAQMLLERFINVANIYQKAYYSEEEIIAKINETLNKKIEVKINNNLDNKSLEKMCFYYNFTNYCLLAGCIYVICLILSSFKSEGVSKRIIVSNMNYRYFNKYLLFSNSIFSFLLWLFYVLLSFILIGNAMFTINGIFYIINSFIFTFCVLCLAFLIGNITKDKNALNGIINVLALGSSFLCGAFVPMELLPNFVLNFAHIFPSHYFIKNNELLKNMEILNLKNLEIIFFNMAIVLIFAVIFIIITNIFSKRKRTI